MTVSALSRIKLCRKALCVFEFFSDACKREHDGWLALVDDAFAAEFGHLTVLGNTLLQGRCCPLREQH